MTQYAKASAFGGGGAGDVVGPASSTDNAIARYDSTTGKLLQNSGANIDDSGFLGINSTDQATFAGMGFGGNLVIKDTASGAVAAINIYSANDGFGLILFNDVAGDPFSDGWIEYDHNTDALSLTAGQIVRQSTGDLEITTLDGSGFGIGSGGFINYYLPLADGTANQVLETDGAGAVTWATPSASGDVVGPASATNRTIAVFDGTTGKLLESDSFATLSSAGNLSTSGYHGSSHAGSVTAATYRFGLDANTGMYQPSADNVAFTTGGTQRLLLNSSGITIGTNYTLPLTDGTANQVLETDGAGAVTWSAGTAGPAGVGVWSTTTAKSAAFTAVEGNLYLVDSSGGTIAITMPASPSNGDVFRVKDSTGSFGTNNVTLTRAGSESIEGIAGNKVLQTNWGSYTIVSDGTNWFLING